MDTNNLQVVLLHHHPEYLKACCDMINEEWPRSETARIMSLKASRDELPTSLILINEKQLVIGHCKLTAIPSMPESCFIETVVISKALRGKKLGTYLMNKVEDYCKNKLHLKMMHLSTKGQEKFYEKLGYEVCAPVSIYGTRLYQPVPNDSIPNGHRNNLKSVPVKMFTSTLNVPPPPPPPPPPPNIRKENITNNNSIKSKKTFMFKYLS